MLSGLLRLVPRLITLLLGVAFVVAAGALVGQMAEFLPAQRLSWNGLVLESAPELGLVWVGVAGLLFLVGLAFSVLAFGGLARAPRSTRLELPGSPEGLGLSVTVAPRTLVSLLRYEASHIEGVRHIDPVISMGDDGWKVDCFVTIWRDRPMRDLAANLDERFRHALFEHTGVNVAAMGLQLDFGTERNVKRVA